MRIRSILISLVCACGGGEGGGGGTGISPASLPAALGEVTCAKLAECCTAEEFMEQTLGADNDAECRALFGGFAGLLADTLEDSIAAGRVIYHGDRMEDCLDIVSASSCTEFQNSGEGFDSSGCEDPFEGQVAVGGECANDFDCISEYCSGDMMDFEGNLTFGQCADEPGDGDACDDGECDDATFCDFNSNTGTPTCVPRRGDGIECTSDDQCQIDNCNVDDSTGMGTCGAPTTCDGN